MSVFVNEGMLTLFKKYEQTFFQESKKCEEQMIC